MIWIGGALSLEAVQGRDRLRKTNSVSSKIMYEDCSCRDNRLKEGGKQKSKNKVNKQWKYLPSDNPFEGKSSLNAECTLKNLK
jgi:hypothetical protein